MRASSPLPLLLIGLVLLMASAGAKASSSSSTKKPKALPKPLGKPPATVTPITDAPTYVVPGSPPDGGVLPGSVPYGGTRPGDAGDMLTVTPTIREYTPAELKALQQRTADRIAQEKERGSAARKQSAVRVPAPLPTLPKGTAATILKERAAAAKKASTAAPKTAAKKPPVPPPAAKKPSGTVPASPVLEPNRGSTPAGYDPVKARARARAIAAYLAKKGPAGYARPELASWQRQAGLKPDGAYGGSTRGALIHYGVKDPPRPFSAPLATLPYVPPGGR